MFSFLRTLVSLIVLATIAGIVIYFLPHDIKLRAIEKISGIVPESIAEKTEELLLTPSESREKLLSKLGENFSELKTASEEKAKELVAQSETLLQKLEEKNKELSLGELARQKLVNLLVKDEEKTECK